HLGNARARDRDARWRRVEVRRSARRRAAGEESASLAFLAARAEEARASALHEALHRRAAAPAGQSCPVVDPVALLKVARGTIGADKVAKRRAAGADRRAQDVLDRRGKKPAALERKARGPRARMDARAKKALVRVDVSHADDVPGVHEELLDRCAACARERVKARRIERARKR